MTDHHRFGPLRRMPLGFGPYPGPRQSPDGGRWDTGRFQKLEIWVRFLCAPGPLAALMPPGFELDGEPTVTVSSSTMKNIEWLAGRGYNVLGITVPARYRGTRDDVRGQLLTVLFENLADPIISGREDLGYSKLFAEIPDIDVRPDWASASVSAAWDGYPFIAIELEGVKEEAVSDPCPPGPTLLHYKYVPKTGEWGAADIEYPTMSRPEMPERRILRRWSGTGSVRFDHALFEQLPTLYHIANRLADLPNHGVVAAGLIESVGGKDYYDQRILV